MLNLLESRATLHAAKRRSLYRWMRLKNLNPMQSRHDTDCKNMRPPRVDYSAALTNDSIYLYAQKWILIVPRSISL